MNTALWSITESIFYKVLEEVAVELRRDSSSQEVKKLDTVDTYVAKKEVKFFHL